MRPHELEYKKILDIENVLNDIENVLVIGKVSNFNNADKKEIIERRSLLEIDNDINSANCYLNLTDEEIMIYIMPAYKFDYDLSMTRLIQYRARNIEGLSID